MNKIITLLLASMLLLGCVSMQASAAEETERSSRIAALDVVVEAIGQELPGDLHVLDQYTDTEDIQEESKKILAFAVSNGIIQGYGDGTLRPYGYLTRAEFAQMLYNASRFFSDKPKLVEFNSGYTDISDWAYDAVVYCMERGFMVGYGNGLFGSLDYLTENQVALMADRLKYGLAAYDTYNLLDANGQSPLIMPLIWQTGYQPSFAEMPEQVDGYFNLTQSSDEKKQEYWERFRSYMEITRNVDYHLLQDPENLHEQDARLWKLMGGGAYSDAFKQRLERETALQVKRESFLVSAPQNSGLFTADLSCCLINGYEYFIYHEGEEAAKSDGAEIGKWYRRKAVITYVYPTGYMKSASFRAEYAEPEPVPEDLLN